MSLVKTLWWEREGDGMLATSHVFYKLVIAMIYSMYMCLAKTHEGAAVPSLQSMRTCVAANGISAGKRGERACARYQ